MEQIEKIFNEHATDKGLGVSGEMYFVRAIV